MPTEKSPEVTEKESLKVAEASRQAEWEKPSFMREFFLGNFRLELIHPFPLPGTERPEFTAFYTKFRDFLKNEVDPAEIDATGEYPQKVLDGPRRLGAFGMKIPAKYGGLGFSNVEYNRVMTLIGTYDGNLAALLSAHQSIGVPQPLKTFGTEELKKKYLPRCAAGEISAFALTEPRVGSDPARLLTTAVKTADGSAYVINGKKLWTTNGTLAKLLVVMAIQPESKKISAFVVETDWPGVSVEHRCRFMGLRAISNAVMDFKDVRVPAENLIGAGGQGPQDRPHHAERRAAVDPEHLRRHREGVPRGRPRVVERARAVGQARSASTRRSPTRSSTSRRARTRWSPSRTSRPRCRTAAGTTSGSRRRRRRSGTRSAGWEIVDETMQIRGGRGYETEQSLAARGDEPIPVERMMRDFRINKIFEGSTEIMHLFMAREMVDKHLQIAGAIIDPDKPISAKLAVLPKMAAYYAWWYPTRWLGWSFWPKYAGFGRLARHLRFVERASRRLSRASFHGMLVYQAKLQNKQAFLFRLVDIANETFAMAASVARAQALLDKKAPQAAEAVRIADVFCLSARRRVRALFAELWSNDDAARYRNGLDVLSGRHEWLEKGTIGLHAKASAPQKEELPVGA